MLAWVFPRVSAAHYLLVVRLEVQVENSDRQASGPVESCPRLYSKSHAVFTDRKRARDFESAQLWRIPKNCHVAGRTIFSHRPKRLWRISRYWSGQRLLHRSRPESIPSFRS